MHNTSRTRFQQAKTIKNKYMKIVQALEKFSRITYIFHKNVVSYDNFIKTFGASIQDGCGHAKIYLHFIFSVFFNFRSSFGVFSQGCVLN